MCQLTFVNLGNKTYHHLLQYIATFINAEENPDGYGFACNGEIYKSKLSANNVTNLGTRILETNNSKHPVFCHVRKATATAGVKEIKEENSHPFEGKRFTLMHNGSLETRDWKLSREDRFKGLIDSAIFHMILEEVAEQFTGNSIVELVQKTYDNFYGKFAFLIHDKVTGKNYAFRGETATLFKVDLEIVDANGKVATTGYIVNTNKDSLLKILLMFTNILQLTYGTSIKWNYSTTWFEALEENTAYELKRGGIEKIGSVKQENKPVYVYNGKEEKPAQSFLAEKKNGTAGIITTNKPVTSSVISALAEEFNVSIEYIDALIFAWYGKGIAYISSTELLNILKEVNEELKRTSVSMKKLRRSWKVLKYYIEGRMSELEAHRKYGIIFPYTKVQNLADIREAIVDIKKELGKK